RHFGIDRMDAPDVAMRQTCAAADEDFPERPILLGHGFSPPFRGDAGSGLRARAALVRIGECGLPYPGAIIVGIASLLDTLAIAGTIARDHALEFRPVDLTVFPMTGFFVLLHRGIRKGQPEILALRHGRIDEFLAQLVVGE